MVITCRSCAARRGSLLHCWRLTDEGQPLSDGTQSGVLGGIFPRAIQGVVHVFVPPTCCCGGHLLKNYLHHEQVSIYCAENVLLVGKNPFMI